MKTVRYLFMMFTAILLGACSSNSLQSLNGTDGWDAGKGPSVYEKGWSKGAGKNGNDALSIRAIKGEEVTEEDAGSVFRKLEAKAYHGKRVELSGWVKTTATGEKAGLWIRVDGNNKALAFDNMDDRMVQEGTDWQHCRLVVDVPRDAREIFYGGLLCGNGQVWMDGITLREVSKSTALTGKYVGQQFDMPTPEEEGYCAKNYAYGYVLPHNKVSYIQYRAGQVQPKQH